MQHLTYRIDFWPDASDWTHGYERAVEPWLRLYTDELLVAWQFPDGSRASLTGVNRLPQHFTVVQRLTLAGELDVTGEILRWQMGHGQHSPEEVAAVAGDPELDGMLRYRWLVGLSNHEVVELVEDRLDEWEETYG